MKCIILPVLLMVCMINQKVWSAPLEDETKPAAKENENTQAELHFGFDTENGQHRTEDIKYNLKSSSDDGKDSNKTEQKPVEYRGGYSFISADGYEYQVLYKANKNGFQPYVTAHKIKTAE